MCLIYKNVESLEKPLESEDTATGVYFRRNITTKEKEGNTVYCYEESFLTLEEYKGSSIFTARENIKNLQAQIDVIDKKRVRALCEPQIKDSESGETWLDFYTGQVLVLRDKITEILKGE